ncbi:MAG TPA: shikimate dehydrogenase [Gemmatimonadales bacterium]|nr:shikimate dehydrogenase [Gemmatimonadales bacterium]
MPARATSRLLAVLGDPVEHSLSPAMFGAAITALGLDAVYVALRVPTDQLETVLAAFRAVGGAGNVTIPHKAAALALMDDPTPLATRVGAVNTFWCENGRLAGDNTDVAGIRETVASLGSSGPWLVQGTGGSARAVAVAAADRDVELLVRSRDPARAERFVAWARAAGAAALPDDGRPVGTAINATPLGLRSTDPAPIPLDRLGDVQAVIDLVYGPNETAWVRGCRTRGIRAVDGRTMLVAQGVAAFRRFFPHVTPPDEIMTAAVRAATR